MDSLYEIANEARFLYAAYPEYAEELRRKREGLQQARANLNRHRLRGDVRPIDVEIQTGAIRDYAIVERFCADCYARVRALDPIVAARWPKLWAELRLVGARCRAWHDEPGLDWPAAVRELRQIEAAALAAESTREAGAATAPPDESQWIGFSTVWPERFTSYKKAKQFLVDTPAIRTRKPSKQRLEVHAGDWARHWAQQGARAFNAIDGEPEQISPDVTAGFVAGAQERYRAILRRKVPKSGGK